MQALFIYLHFENHRPNTRVMWLITPQFLVGTNTSIIKLYYANALEHLPIRVHGEEGVELELTFPFP